MVKFNKGPDCTFTNSSFQSGVHEKQHQAYPDAQTRFPGLNMKKCGYEDLKRAQAPAAQMPPGKSHAFMFQHPRQQKGSVARNVNGSGRWA